MWPTAPAVNVQAWACSCWRVHPPILINQLRTCGDLMHGVCGNACIRPSMISGAVPGPGWGRAVPMLSPRFRRANAHPLADCILATAAEQNQRPSAKNNVMCLFSHQLHGTRLYLPVTISIVLRAELAPAHVHAVVVRIRSACLDRNYHRHGDNTGEGIRRSRPAVRPGLYRLHVGLPFAACMRRQLRVQRGATASYKPLPCSCKPLSAGSSLVAAFYVALPPIPSPRVQEFPLMGHHARP